MKAINGEKPDYFVELSSIGDDGSISWSDMVHADNWSRTMREASPDWIPVCHIPHTQVNHYETDIVCESNFATVSEELARYMRWDGEAHTDCTGCERASEVHDRSIDRHGTTSAIVCEALHDPDCRICDAWIDAPNPHEIDGHECDACQCDTVITFTTGLLYRVDRPIPKDVAEVVGSLESYCMFDESDVSERESEDEHEQWCDWGRRDARKALIDAIEIDENDGVGTFEDLLDSVSDRDFDSIWYDRCEAFNAYPERGSDVNFQIDRWIERCTSDTITIGYGPDRRTVPNTALYDLIDALRRVSPLLPYAFVPGADIALDDSIALAIEAIGHYPIALGRALTEDGIANWYAFVASWQGVHTAIVNGSSAR